jgi:TM2 domain-containing membrane protein YozV
MNARTFGRKATGDDGMMAARRAAFLAEERARAALGSPEGFGRPAYAPDPVYAREKSLGTAYAFWFFLGGWGAHRFYLGYPVSGMIQALLWPMSWMLFLSKSPSAIIPLSVAGIWVLADAFLIPGLRRKARARMRGEVASVFS